jgi:hypothetical protein
MNESLIPTNHPDPNKYLYPWTNVYVATNSEVVRRGTPRHFTPDEMPVRAVDPDCAGPPVFVVQGSLGRRRLDGVRIRTK